jgi:hypothetical protein
MRVAALAPALALGLLGGVVAVAPAAAAADPTVTVEVSPASPQVGEDVTVSGDVTDANGDPVSMAALSGSRTDSAGEHPLMGMTDADGHYSIQDTPTAYGDVTWTVTWNETSGRQTATVTRRPTSVSLAVSNDQVRSGATISLTGHLGSPTTDRTLTIYAKPYGEGREQVESGTVDASGDLHASYEIERGTKFIARFKGDDTYAPESAKRSVTVRARLGNTLVGGYDTVHGYRLYHVGSDATVTAHLRPELVDVCLYFKAQRHYSGAWHTVTVSPCLRTGSEGRVSSELKGETVQVDKPYRVRAEWRGGPGALADKGPWLKLRFRG